jgi:DNA polymerase III alpha subunit
MIEYDANGIGGEDLNGKVKAIKSWSEKIMNVQKKKTTNKKNIFTEGFHKFGKKTKNTMKKFLTFVKKEQKGKDNNNDNKDVILENEMEKEKEKAKDKIEEEVELTKEEEMLLKELTTGLYNLLKEECVLCGQYMINSTQIQFSEEDENIKWGKLVVN